MAGSRRTRHRRRPARSSRRWANARRPTRHGRTNICVRGCWRTAASLPAIARGSSLSITHLPILLVLIVACTNVGTLVYARTATREAEIATRYALGAGRVADRHATVRRSAGAGVAGRGHRTRGAHIGRCNGACVSIYAGQSGGPPFWVNPGLKPMTILYAAMLTIAGAAILGVLPALKVTSSHVHTQLRNLGAGGSTLRFGKFWTTAMIVQVALTVILLAAGVRDLGRGATRSTDPGASSRPRNTWPSASSSIANRQQQAATPGAPITGSRSTRSSNGESHRNRAFAP